MVFAHENATIKAAYQTTISARFTRNIASERFAFAIGSGDFTKDQCTAEKRISAVLQIASAATTILRRPAEGQVKSATKASASEVIWYISATQSDWPVRLRMRS